MAQPSGGLKLRAPTERFMRALLVFGLLLLAGCATTEPATSSEPSTAPSGMDVAMERGDGAHVLAGLKAFVDVAPQRFDNLFQHDAARDFLEQALQDGGLQVTRGNFTGAGQVESPTEGQNLVATIPGRTNIMILVGAHYDSAVSSFGAAYDDGTGTMLTVELARAAATREWNHTLVFALFDQEEAGLVGSRAMAQALRDDDVPLALMINLDMVGINWPVGVGGTVNPIPLNFYVGGNEETALAATWAQAVEAAGYPAHASTQTTGLGGGSSDHGPFRDADFTAAWLRGALIGSYPAYHNLDRVEAMTALVGGDESNLVAAFQTVLDTTLAFLESIDQEA